MLTFGELSQKYLAWVKTHQAQRTYEWYANYLDMFCAFPGIRELPAYDLKPYQVQEWIDSYGDKWGSTYKGGAVVAVKRVYNWAEELGYGDGNPVKKLKKSPPQRRKIYMKPDDYEDILKHIRKEDPFYDLFMFVWHSGCRPQEVRHIEKRHVFMDKKKIIFPAEESKGKKSERIIRLNDITMEIIQRIMRDEGKLFLNTDGNPWTKYAICNRFSRLSKILKRRLFCYSARHGFGTRKLIQGHDPITVAALMGHVDGTMLSRVYSHVEDDDEHMNSANQD